MYDRSVKGYGFTCGLRPNSKPNHGCGLHDKCYFSKVPWSGNPQLLVLDIFFEVRGLTALLTDQIILPRTTARSKVTALRAAFGRAQSQTLDLACMRIFCQEKHCSTSVFRCAFMKRVAAAFVIITASFAEEPSSSGFVQPLACGLNTTSV